MIKPFGLIEELKWIKLILLIFILWVIILTVLIIFLMIENANHLKAWQEQIKINKTLKEFAGKQNDFNERLDKYVLVNLR